VISRYLLIALAFALGVYRAVQGAWLPSSGLFAMAIGLAVLKLAERRAALRPLAYVCFAATAATIVVMIVMGRR
jgi:hypothetical protein